MRKAKRRTVFAVVAILWGVAFSVEANSFADGPEQGQTGDISVFDLPGLCGPRALWACCREMSLDVRFEELVQLSGHEGNGTSMYGLREAAKAIGWNAVGLKMDARQVDTLKCPFIAFVNGNHFIAVIGRDGGELTVEDDGARTRWSLRQFEQVFSGKVLAIANQAPGRSIEKGPRMAFDELEYDSGAIWPGNQVSHEFVFRNAGSGILRIDELRASCTCTERTISATTVPSGGTGTIRITTTFPSLPGAHKQSVFVHSNDAGHPWIKLSLTGAAQAARKAAPSKLDFGIVRYNRTVEEVILVVLPAANVAIESVTSSSECVAIGKTSTLIHAEYQVVSIPVRASANARRGPFQADVVITTTDQAEPMRIPVRGEFAGPLSVWPRDAFLAIVPQGIEKAVTVRVTNSGDSALRVTGVRSLLGMPKLTYSVREVEEGRVYEITVGVGPSAKPGALTDELVLETDPADGDRIRIPVSGFVQGQGECAVRD